MLGVPLLREGSPIGVIALLRTVVMPFTDRQIDLVKTFADQAVIAIENARLFYEVRARTDELSEALRQQTATAEVLQVISGSAFDLQPVFDAVAESSVKLCEAERAFIFRYDGELLRVVAGFNSPPEFKEWVAQHPIRPGRHSVTARAALERQTIHIPDVRADPEYSYGAKDVEPIRTVLGVPILKGDDLLGVIIIYRFEVRPFTDKQIALVETFADQSAIAIENVRLFEEVQQRTEALVESLQQQTATADVLKVISRSAFDLPTVLRTLVESAARLCEADKTSIIRQKGDGLYVTEAYGFSQEFIEAVKDMPIEPTSGLAAGRALLESQVVHIPDVEADPDYTFTAKTLGDIRTTLAVPMLREGEAIGVLILTRSDVRPFTEKQIDTASTFADQATIAIENVRLFDSVETRTRELAKSLEDLRATQDRLVQTEKLASLGQLTAGIAHEIKNPLNFVNNFSSLGIELIGELEEALKAPRRQSQGTDHRACRHAQRQPGQGRRAWQTRRFDRQEHAAAFPAGVRRTSAGRHQRPGRGEPESCLSRRTCCKAGLQHHAGAIPRPGCRKGGCVSPGDYPGAAQFDLQWLLRCDEAEGRGPCRGLWAHPDRYDQGPRRHRRDQDTRQRHWDSARGQGEDIQSVLHDETRWRRDWSRPFPQLRHHREAAWRFYRGRHAAWRVHRVQDRIAAFRCLCCQARRTSVSFLILVVDDEPDVELLFRQQFRRDLRDGRFAMEFAQSAQGALQRITECDTDTSLILILSDINMPGMSGLDLLPKAKAARPDVPVIMITAYGDADTRRKALANGADAFLTKPLDFAIIRDEIDTRVRHAA
jgi:GAF domain-containing protein/ActR/RegA family two-component response regulator